MTLTYLGGGPDPACTVPIPAPLDTGPFVDLPTVQMGENDTIEARFPALNDHLIRMASTGNVGSLTEWGDFFNCLRIALGVRP